MTKTMKDKKHDEAADLKNQLARALADYDNLQKRTEVQRASIQKLANLQLVVRLLPVVDMVESAQGHLKDSGLALAIKELKDVLKDEGYEEIGVKVGDNFDEQTQEAVEVEEDGKTGKIKEILLAGWQTKDGIVVRPVKVKVSK